VIALYTATEPTHSQTLSVGSYSNKHCVSGSITSHKFLTICQLHT